MRAGIVGCGRIAAYHLPAMLARLGPQAIAVTDTNREAAERLAERHRLRAVYPDMETMLSDYRPDVVHVLTPPVSHSALARTALESGIHVLVEKPMAMDYRQAMGMVEAARRNNSKLCVDHNFLYQPIVRSALSLIEQGRAGRVLNVEVRYAFDLKRARPLQPNGGEDTVGWLDGIAGGIFFDSLPHPASILLKVTGKPEKVLPVIKNNGILPNGAPDELTVLVEGTRAIGTMSISLGTRPDCFSVAIYTTHMTLHLNCSNMTFVVRKHRKLPKILYRAFDNLEQAARLFGSTVSNSFWMTLGRVSPPGDISPVIHGFYDSIEKGLMPPVPGEEAAQVIRLADEIWKTEGGGLDEDTRNRSDRVSGWTFDRQAGEGRL